MTPSTLLNLGLAVVPVLLAYLLAWGLGTEEREARLPPLIVLALALLWLLFLPNAPYLLTQWRHYPLEGRINEAIDAALVDRAALVRLAKTAGAFVGYGALGALLTTLSIRPLERWVRETGGFPEVLLPPLFFLNALGVYLGLVVRLNSWDFLRHPSRVVELVLRTLTQPVLLGIIAVFGAFLWVLYEGVDLWIDALQQRVREWREEARREQAERADGDDIPLFAGKAPDPESGPDGAPRVG